MGTAKETFIAPFYRLASKLSTPNCDPLQEQVAALSVRQEPVRLRTWNPF